VKKDEWPTVSEVIEHTMDQRRKKVCRGKSKDFKDGFASAMKELDKTTKAILEIIKAALEEA